jgi:hypothetical protein
MNTDVVHESIGKWGVGWKVGDKCRSGPESGEKGGETLKADRKVVQTSVGSESWEGKLLKLTGKSQHKNIKQINVK